MTHALLTPVSVYVAFCFLIIVLMAVARVRAIASGELKGRKIKLGERNWPERVQRISNVAQNQWETPVLFWAAAALALILDVQTPLLMGFAWLFVVARMLHAAIYISVNHILARFLSFGVSLVAMAGMWVVIALETFSA
ncbi:MAPEG family protein [Maricaulis sp.]|uniref:MAPEG family protein n=1 Tax=Maricaulis sp. TaxID=1486257 RepID=UPI00262A3C8A|nr:MAPEG family protein [Maricaulis sp.]